MWNPNDEKEEEESLDEEEMEFRSSNVDLWELAQDARELQQVSSGYWK